MDRAIDKIHSRKARVGERITELMNNPVSSFQSNHRRSLIDDLNSTDDRNGTGTPLNYVVIGDDVLSWKVGIDGIDDNNLVCIQRIALRICDSSTGST